MVLDIWVILLILIFPTSVIHEDSNISLTFSVCDNYPFILLCQTFKEFFKLCIDGILTR